MTKKQIREQVYQKYNGRCAYCGHEIAIKDMQIDHIIPQRLGGADNIDCKKLNARTEQVERLKKENAELKEQVKKVANTLAIHCQDTQKVIDEYEQENAGAKKIIGNLYAICKDNHYPNSSVLMEQTEQFLKEV